MLSDFATTNCSADLEFGERGSLRGRGWRDGEQERAREREREREREGGRERPRQRERESDADTDSDRDKQDSQTGRQAGGAIVHDEIIAWRGKISHVPGQCVYVVTCGRACVRDRERQRETETETETETERKRRTRAPRPYPTAAS